MKKKLTQREKAFADYYSNGSKAQKESIAIVNVVNQLWRS